MESSPNSSKANINTFFAKCRCCLEYGYMKSMWSEYDRDGTKEIYGEMLLDTFSITWPSLDDSQDYICESCVIRLRDASDFKKEVLASDQLMQEEMDEMDTEETQFKVEMLEDFDENDENIQEDELEEEKANASDAEYYEVEYLEEEMDEETKASISEKLDDAIPKETKYPQKKKKQEITRVYKKYSEDDMRQCLEAVRQKTMTISEASKYYGVPVKTVCTRLNSELNKKKPDSPKDLEKIVNQEKNRSFVEEIKTILAYTNAVPFKTKGGKFFCTYCSIDGFDDPDELRLHSEFHEDVWLKNVEHILRPHFQNEILRLDMENLRCKHCDSRIKTWNDMFQHLRELHQMELDQAYTRLVPFKLRREFMNCALCDEHFINFTYLDNHMNSHYCNYMCSECGDTFLAENRLKHHIQIHNTGKFKCHVCGKVFSLEKYMRKHQAMVHRMNKIFKCTYCPERFHVEYERHTHIVEKHKEKVRIYTCELCGKSFDWRPYYLAHLRKAHSKVKKHKCRFCTKAFVSKHEVKLHEQRHTGDGKHVCTKCNNNYVTLAELRLHLKKHFKEVGYSPLKIET